jgi:hypothetical protein
MFFDQDNTHDSLFAQRIKPAILSLLKNALDHRGIFDNPFPFCLIERIAVGALNPWADNWTGKMFDFLKELSRTFILDDGYLNGSAYGFEPQYTADLPDLIDLEEYHTDKITVRVPGGATGILTWLERTHDEQSAPYCSKLTNRLTIAMRRSRLFKNTAAQPLEIEIYTKNWLHNSVCFQGVELVGLTGNQADFLLYDQMQSFLDFLMGELNLTPCKVLTGMTAKVTAEGRMIGIGNYESNIKTKEAILPIFNLVPNSFFNCYLHKATGGDQGNMTTIFNKENQILQINTSYAYSFFKAWEDTLTKTNPRGYELNQDPFSNKGYTVLNYPCLFENAPLDFRTFKNNHDLEKQWDYTAVPFTSYPPLSRKQFLANDQNGFYCFFNLTPTLGGNKDLLFPPQTGASLGFVRWMENENNENEVRSTFPDFPNYYDPSLKGTNGPYYYNYSFFTKGEAVVFGLLADDLTLFRSGEVAIVQAEINFFQTSFVQWVASDEEMLTPDFNDNLNTNSYQNVKAYKRKLSAVLKISEESQGQAVSLLETLAWNQLGLAAEFQTLSPTPILSGLYFQDNATDPITIENTVMLRREFR